MENRFYVYQYLREDGTPYYIGKGTGKRATQKHYRGKGSNITPTDKSRIQIVMGSLPEKEALELEEFLIAEIGRKQDGGILINTRSGGEENSGQVFTEETRKKQSISASKRRATAQTKAKMSKSGRLWWENYDSTIRDEKISKTLKGRVIGCNKKKSIAAKKRYRQPVSCLECRKEGKMPTMVSHFRKCQTH